MRKWYAVEFNTGYFDEYVNKSIMEWLDIAAELQIQSYVIRKPSDTTTEFNYKELAEVSRSHELFGALPPLTVTFYYKASAKDSDQIYTVLLSTWKKLRPIQYGIFSRNL